MTATPIPRTLALTVYGDLDVSTLRELPADRQPVSTRWVDETARHEIYERIREAVAAGRQAYIVYPLIEESEALDLKAATQMYEQLCDDVFVALRVALLHGRLDSDEKERIMGAFAAGEVDVLVSTIVIEVGVDVPNATVMLVEHAERFGLAQLHQLRGRIGRGRERAECWLLSGTTGEEATARLSALVESRDGFVLAERDLELRGPGELLGVRQHGEPLLRTGHLLQDAAILEQGRVEAERLLAEDAQLARPAWRALRELLVARYGPDVLDLVAVG